MIYYMNGKRYDSLEELYNQLMSDLYVTKWTIAGNNSHKPEKLNKHNLRIFFLLTDKVLLIGPDLDTVLIEKE